MRMRAVVANASNVCNVCICVQGPRMCGTFARLAHVCVRVIFVVMCNVCCCVQCLRRVQFSGCVLCLPSYTMSAFVMCVASCFWVTAFSCVVCAYLWFQIRLQCTMFMWILVCSSILLRFCCVRAWIVFSKRRANSEREMSSEDALIIIDDCVV